jgi:hypothetical protein
MNVNEDFVDTYGAEVFLQIGETMGDTNGFAKIVDSWNTSPYNSEGYAFFTLGDKTINFSYINGNNNGFEITEFSEDEIERPQRYATISKFALDVDRIATDKLPLMQAKFNAKLSEIEDMSRKMNYDMTFSPTLVIERHYRDYADKNYLKVVSEQIEVD